MTDNILPYDATNFLTLTTDRLLLLLRVETATIRKLYERKQVTLKWVGGKHQLSNCLSKKGTSPLCLPSVLKTALIILFMTEYGQA